MDLPLGSQLIHLVLDTFETVRSSGDDLECFFYTLSHHPTWYPKNAIGRRPNGADFADMGAIPGKIYRACLKVAAMGDPNGVATAQQTHEALFTSAGCLHANQGVRYSGVTPIGPTWELVYLDDHNVTQRLPRARLRCTPAGCKACQLFKVLGLPADVSLVDKSVDAYATNNLPRNEDKSYRYQQ